jgi:D-glycero-D-manno-heptose 1,7-bisphosphate phosphatase
MSVRGLVILDRDGVINEDSASFVRTPADWTPIPGSLEAIGRLCAAGLAVAVATNQSGLARGYLDASTLAAIHKRMATGLAEHGGRLACIAFCPHGPDDDCACRKPKPGLLAQIGVRLGVPLAGVPFVGDSARDLDAARAAGCEPVLVRTGNGAQTEVGTEARAVRVFDDLAAFVDAHLAERVARETISC